MKTKTPDEICACYWLRGLPINLSHFPYELCVEGSRVFAQWSQDFTAYIPVVVFHLSLDPLYFWEVVSSI
jgi:hypothetical protein